MVKLLVGSDEPIVRGGLREIVRTRDGWAVTAEAADAEALLAAVRGGVDVAILAAPLGTHDGIELVERIRAMAPALPLIVLASYVARHYAISFLRAGANAFVNRNASAEEILAAIDAVAGGGQYLSPLVAGEMIRGRGAAGRPEQPHERLSVRELEVFRLLAAGRSPTAIAAMLGVSVKTVSTYRSRILEKTGFRSNADMVGYAIRHRMV